MTWALLGCAITVDDLAGGAAPDSALLDSAAEEPEDGSDAAYARDHLVEVEVTLSDEDWSALRQQDRTILEMFDGQCMDEPFESPFTWFTGQVTVDGATYAEVGVRKKGLLGSLDEARPSLKIRLDKYVDDVEWNGIRRLVLNNGRQDPTRLRTCLAYDTWRDAGALAPRCTLAHVAVNGEDLGVYALVEPVDEDFMERQVGTAEVALYEGTLSDFRQGWTGTFEPETDVSDGHEVLALADLVESGATLDQLGAVLDVEHFLQHWALEGLAGHWDGYAANTNNFYVFVDPASGLLRFVPWGPDASFTAADAFGNGAPTWIAADAALPRVALDSDGGLDRYRDHLRAVVAGGWDTDRKLGDLDQLAALAAPHGDETWEDEVQALRRLVKRRSADVLEAIDDGVHFDQDLRGPPCFVEHGSASGTFATTWGSYDTTDPFTTGSVTLDVEYDGNAVPILSGGAVAGEHGDSAVVLLATVIGTETYLVPYLQVGGDRFVPGTVSLDFLSATGGLYYYGPDTGGEYVLSGYLAGELVLDEASTTRGGPVSGSFAATILQFGW